MTETKVLIVDCNEMGRHNSKLPDMEGVGVWLKDCGETEVKVHWCWNCKLYFREQHFDKKKGCCIFCGKDLPDPVEEMERLFPDKDTVKS